MARQERANHHAVAATLRTTSLSTSTSTLSSSITTSSSSSSDSSSSSRTLLSKWCWWWRRSSKACFALLLFYAIFVNVHLHFYALTTSSHLDLVDMKEESSRGSLDTTTTTTTTTATTTLQSLATFRRRHGGRRGGDGGDGKPAKQQQQQLQQQKRPENLPDKQDQRKRNLLPVESKNNTNTNTNTATTATATDLSSNAALELIVQQEERQEKQDQQQQVQDQQQQQNQQQQNQQQEQPLQQLPKLQPPKSTAPYLSTLTCDAHGGPAAEYAQEMVYWKNIPADYQVVSPYFQQEKEQFLTFEPDRSGWNNVRMAMETILAVAFATGRTLVLPPEQQVWNINVATRHVRQIPSITATNHTHEQFQRVTVQRKKQKAVFSFNDFFHLHSTTAKYKGLKVITTQEFLETQIMTGKFWKDKNTTAFPIQFPPMNRTNWNGVPANLLQKRLFAYYRTIMPQVVWNPELCQLAFADSPSDADLQQLLQSKQQAQSNPRDWSTYIGNPVPVSASASDRFQETRGQREDANNNLCLYLPNDQAPIHLHYPADTYTQNEPGQPPRLLAPFYSFVFFHNWNYQLYLHRLIRDTVRYNAEITCAAARVVTALRQRVLERTGDVSSTYYDAIHIRRGDFVNFFPTTDTDISTIHAQLSRVLPATDRNLTLYVATDEKNLDFFQQLRDQYDVVFLNDFKDELGDVNTNYYGMIDQLIASRSRYFFGCWYSTFTAYINRLRGYHHDNNKGPGYEHGIIPSWYYNTPERFDAMQRYEPIRKPYWEREFPVGWRMSEYEMETFHASLFAADRTTPTKLEKSTTTTTVLVQE